MVAGDDVIDISLDPVAERRRRRRAWLRVGLPLAGVALMIATILAIAYSTVRANRQGALALSQNLLDTLEDRIALEVSAYLDAPAMTRTGPSRVVTASYWAGLSSFW